MNGPYEPAQGHRFNPAKALLDPYAKAIAGTLEWQDAFFGYRIGDPDGGRHAARSRQRALPAQERGGGRDVRLGRRPPAAHPLVAHRHLRGPRQGLHPAPSRRGARAARHLRGPRVRRGGRHLTELGVTAVELLPIHHSVTEKYQADRGFTNYWGYNSIGFFAPDSRFSASGQPGPAGGRVQDHGEAAAPGGHRGASSTWCTTTPRRATTWARRSASAASTTPRTTASRPRIRASTSTTPAPATR